MHAVYSFPNSSLRMPVMGHLQFNQPTTSVVGFIRHQKIINRFNGLKPLKWFIGFHLSVIPWIHPWDHQALAAGGIYAEKDCIDLPGFGSTNIQDSRSSNLAGL